MRYGAAVAALVVGFAVVHVAHSDGPPRPSIVPISWELEFDFQAPQPMSVRLAGEARAERYWYMLYTVTNRTGADRYFVPEFVLYTDTGEILRAGEAIPHGVFQAIQKRHNNPLLLSASEINGKILQGEDNAKDGVAIWREFDARARSFDVFVGGLSGERGVAKLTGSAPGQQPAAGAAPGEPASRPTPATGPAVVARTLRIHYAIPGEVSARDRTTPRLEGKEWVMR